MLERNVVAVGAASEMVECGELLALLSGISLKHVGSVKLCAAAAKHLGVWENACTAVFRAAGNPVRCKRRSMLDLVVMALQELQARITQEVQVRNFRISC